MKSNQYILYFIAIVFLTSCKNEKEITLVELKQSKDISDHLRFYLNS